MTMDRNGRTHTPAGMPGGGRFQKTDDPGADADLGWMPDPLDAAGWEAKARLEAMGGTSEAAEYAHSLGALTFGDRIPYGSEGVGAWWNGRELYTVDFHNGMALIRDEFDPRCIHPDVDGDA